MSETLAPVTVMEIIRAPGAARFRLMVLAFISLFMCLEGYDTQVMGFAAPAIIHAWNSSKAAFGMVFGILQFGFLVGATLFGSLGDKVGRKRIITIAAFGVGVLTFLCAYAPGLNTFMVLRALTGVAIGAAIPNAIALIAEYSPKGREGTWVGIGYVGYAVGNMVGGLLSAIFIPQFGWESVFLIGGVAPIAVGLLFIVVLPESARFMVVRGKDRTTLIKLLNRINPAAHFSADAQFEAAQVVNLPAVPVGKLFADGRMAMTLLLWAAVTTAFIASHFLSSWLPTVIESSGLSLRYAAMAGSIFMAGGFVGSYAVGYLLDKFGTMALALNYAIAVPCVAALGSVGHTGSLVLILIALAGFTTVGGQVAIYGFAGSVYPTTIRSTGVGWALGIGRCGSIVGPVLGGILLSMNFSLETLYGCAAAPLLITVAALVILRKYREVS